MCKLPDESKDVSILEPKSWDDYIAFAGWMIYKKILIVLLILIVFLLSIIIIWLLRPKPRPEPPSIPVYYYFDELLKLYSGEVIIINENDKVIYRGQVQNGLRSGWGESLFAFDGSVKYEGGFQDDLYEGYGTLFDDYGKLQYTGQFANGMFNGEGILFENDKKKYEGSFVGGLPDGDGILYDESGNIRYQGGFAIGVRAGEGLETNADGFPVYKGEFRRDMYDGHGVLYTSGGSKLIFEGVFVRGKPTREGKIYNSQGQLLYNGPVLDGKVDCLALLGLGAIDWKESVKEKPVVYFGDGYVGYLYGELGISAIGLYEVTPPKAEEPDYEILYDEQPSTEEEQDSPPFQTDDIIFYTTLVEGQQYSEQLPINESVEVDLHEMNGFEAFMSSRLAAVADPTVKIGTEAEVKRIDSNTYEVTGLPDVVDFDGDCFYHNLIYYYYGGKDVSKGGVADIIHCRKRQFGG